MDRLVLQQTLSRGQSLYSPNRRFRLILQEAGNLVLYAAGVSSALWHADTFGQATTGLIMQVDGNLVRYNTAGRSAWDTYTRGAALRNGANLRTQDDGNVVLYDPEHRAIWNTATVVPAGMFVPPNDNALSNPFTISLPTSIVLTSDTNNSGVINLGGVPKRRPLDHPCAAG